MGSTFYPVPQLKKAYLLTTQLPLGRQLANQKGTSRNIGVSLEALFFTLLPYGPWFYVLYNGRTRIPNTQGQLIWLHSRSGFFHLGALKRIRSRWLPMLHALLHFSTPRYSLVIRDTLMDECVLECHCQERRLGLSVVSLVRFKIIPSTHQVYERYMSMISSTS